MGNYYVLMFNSLLLSNWKWRCVDVDLIVFSFNPFLETFTRSFISAHRHTYKSVKHVIDSNLYFLMIFIAKSYSLDDLRNISVEYWMNILCFISVLRLSVYQLLRTEIYLQEWLILGDSIVQSRKWQLQFYRGYLA